MSRRFLTRYEHRVVEVKIPGRQACRVAAERRSAVMAARAKPRPAGHRRLGLSSLSSTDHIPNSVELSSQRIIFIDAFSASFELSLKINRVSWARETSEITSVLVDDATAEFDHNLPASHALVRQFGGT